MGLYLMSNKQKISTAPESEFPVLEEEAVVLMYLKSLVHTTGLAAKMEDIEVVKKREKKQTNLACHKQVFVSFL